MRRSVAFTGAKVGDHKLDSAWTDYSYRVYYQSFDVTASLRTGANAFGVMLGNGWWSCGPARFATCIMYV